MAYISKWKGTEIDDNIQKVVDNSETWDAKQEKLKGKQGQVVGFDALGNAVAQNLNDGDAVTSFNGRSGDVLPQTGDYTAAMVGAKPAEWMPTPSDIGALSDDTFIPTKTSDLENDSGFITASDLGDIDIGDLENVVHVEGGATLEIPVSIGNAPHVITVTEESGEGGGGGGGGNVDLSNLITLTGGGNVNLVGDFGNAPYVIEITESTEDDGSGSSGASVASDVSYDNTDTEMEATNVQEAIDELFQSVSEGKSLIASAVTDKGVETTADDSFQTMHDNILSISTVPDGLHTITVQPNDATMGTVSGGGLASEGMTVTVSAEPEEGHEFNGWDENGNTVSEDNEYTFAVTGDRTLSALFAEKVSRLPEGYTELQYIESDSRCSIKTNLTVNYYDKIILDIEAKTYVSGSEYLWGQSGTGQSNYLLRSSSTQLQYVFSSSASIGKITLNIANQRLLFEYDGPNRKLRIGETEYNVTMAYDESASIFLLGYASGSGIPAKLYSATIYKSGEAVREFVPCINPSGTIGLYDLANGVFYGNAGTGSFTAGPAV